MQFMKKMLSSLFAAILVVSITICPAFAAEATQAGTTYVRDHYNLLTSSDLQSMESTAKQMSETNHCDVYLVIVKDLQGYSARQFAKAYWSQYDLGQGADRDGIMLLIAVNSRDYVTITHGQGATGGVTIFTDFRIGQIETSVVNELRGNNWVSGFKKYLQGASDTFAFYSQNGKPWDVSNDPEEMQTQLYMKLAGSILIPLIIAALICAMWAKQMKTARLKHEANDYFEQGSLVLTRQRDQYVTTTRNVVKIEEPKGGPGGGSSVDFGGFGGSSGGKF